MNVKRDQVRLIAVVAGLVGGGVIAFGFHVMSVRLVVYGGTLLLIAFWAAIFFFLTNTGRIPAIIALAMMLLLVDQYTFGGPARHGIAHGTIWQIAASGALIATLSAAVVLSRRRHYRAALWCTAGEAVGFLSLNAFYIARDGLETRLYVVDSASPLPGVAFLLGVACRMLAIICMLSQARHSVRGITIAGERTQA
jgi:hypothetical protein